MLNKKNILIFCLVLTPLIGFGLDLYTPSLPAIMNYFHVSHFSAKLTIIFYIAGVGFAQPLVGIISDHTQRKIFLLTALVIYCVSSFASSWSPSIDVLFAFRIINAICAACISVVIKSVILDNFTGKLLAKANNYFTLSWSLTPMVAPVIGGYLQQHFEWQSNFYFMGLYALIGVFLSFMLLKEQQTIRTHKHIFTLSSVIQKWKTVLSDRIYIVAILILSVENAILFLYYTAGPFIIQTTLHYSAAQYGEITLFAGASYFCGNIINNWLLNYFDLKKIILFGLIVSLIVLLISIVIMQFSVSHTEHDIYFVTIPIFLVFACDGLIFSNVMTHTLERYNKFSGIAGGLLSGLLNLLSSTIVSVCTYVWNMHHILTLNITYFILLGVSLFAFSTLGIKQ